MAESKRSTLAELRKRAAEEAQSPDGRRMTPTLRLDRLAAVLPALCGRTIERVFLSEYPGQRFRVIFAFADGMTYEFYGTGEICGTSDVEPGTPVVVRERLERDAPLQVHEVG